jgi:hypothetical protein
MKLNFYMTPACRFHDLPFSFEGHDFAYSALPPQIRFNFGQARLALLEKSETEVSVWADGIKLGNYTKAEEIPEDVLREAVLLGLRALAFESEKIDSERLASEERFVT